MSPKLARWGWWGALVVFALLVSIRPVAQRFEPEPPGTRVVLWHSQRGQELLVLEALLRQFNEANAGRIWVQPLGVPEDSLKDKLVRNIPRGSGPDLFIRPHNELGELHLEGVVGSIGGPELARTWDPKLLAGMSVDGVTYGLPLTYKGLFLFYNTELCPEGPPADTGGLAALRERLSEGTFPLVYDTTSFFFHAPFFLGNGERIFGDETVGEGATRGRRFALLDRRQDSSFAWPGEWKQAGILPSEPNYNEMVRLFEGGKAAMVVNGPWYLPSGEVAKSDKWAVAPLFAVNGRPTGSLVTVEGLFLSVDSRHPEEAKDLARFLAGPEGARARFERLGLPPGVMGELPESGDALRRRMVEVQRLALANGQVTPNDPRMASVWTPAKDVLEASVAGRDLAEAMDRAQKELDKADRRVVESGDWRVAGAILAALLVFGTWRLVVVASREAKGDEAARARLIGFHGRAALPYLLPGVLAVVVLVFVPLLVGAGMAFFTHEFGSFRYVGLANFAEILLVSVSDAMKARSFYFALGVTVLWTVTNVFFHVAIGMGLALLLRPSWNRLRTAYRVVLILPWAIPNYITALMWKGMFNAQVGAVNVILSALGLDFAGFNWFDRFTTAFTANLVTNMWLGFPFMMVVTLGALQAIPAEQEEAAILDGASRWQRFWLVLFPHIRPALVPSIILGVTWTFNAFNIIYLVSGGAPGSQTDILVSEAYRWAFERGQKYGYAAAYSVLIFLFLFGYSWVTNRMQKAEAR